MEFYFFFFEAVVPVEGFAEVGVFFVDELGCEYRIKLFFVVFDESAYLLREAFGPSFDEVVLDVDYYQCGFCHYCFDIFLFYKYLPILILLLK